MFSLALLAKRVRRNSTLDYCFLYLRTKKRHINRNLTVFNNRNKELYRNNISFFTVYKLKYIFIVQNEQNKIHL